MPLRVPKIGMTNKEKHRVQTKPNPLFFVTKEKKIRKENNMVVETTAANSIFFLINNK